MLVYQNGKGYEMGNAVQVRGVSTSVDGTQVLVKLNGVPDGDTPDVALYINGRDAKSTTSYDSMTPQNSGTNSLLAYDIDFMVINQVDDVRCDIVGDYGTAYNRMVTNNVVDDGSTGGQVAWNYRMEVGTDTSDYGYSGAIFGGLVPAQNNMREIQTLVVEGSEGSTILAMTDNLQYGDTITVEIEGITLTEPIVLTWDGVNYEYSITNAGAENPFLVPLAEYMVLLAASKSTVGVNITVKH